MVVNVPRDGLSVDYLENRFDTFEASDDVFNSAFRHQSVIIAQPLNSGKPSSVIPQGVLTFLEQGLSSMLVFIDSQQLPEGPYFLRNHRLHQAWRLYPDESLAFVTSVIPLDSNEEYRCVCDKDSRRGLKDYSDLNLGFNHYMPPPIPLHVQWLQFHLAYTPALPQTSP